VRKQKSKTSKKKITDETTKCNSEPQTSFQISSGITPVDDIRKLNKQLTKSIYYNAMMHSVGIYRPGYVIHESCNWNPYHSKWFFLPQRASHEKYDDQADEKRATNLIFVADSTFIDIKSWNIGPLNPTHGFSSFQFIPQTKDTVIVALKTEEDKGRIASCIMAFNSNGEILMEEQRIGDIKFEGIEFI